MRYTVEYFNQSVLDGIERWPVRLLADYARELELLIEFGPGLGMPHSRAMGGGLFELRPRCREGAGRAVYCFVSDRRIIVLHAFMKKTGTTPHRDMHLARKRLKEVDRG